MSRKREMEFQFIDEYFKNNNSKEKDNNLLLEFQKMLIYCHAF